MKQFPYICECGYNTMDSSKARAHSDKHTLETVRAVYAPWARILQYARGRMIFVCPVGFNLEDVSSPSNHGHVFYITQAELDNAGGWIACEYCGCKCLRLDNIKIT